MACRIPCPTCPWRRDQDASRIPNFDLALAEGLRETCPRDGFGQNFGDPIFACHLTRPGQEVPCAGWLAVVGHRHPNIRLMVASRELPVEALAPGDGWPALHESYDDLLAKLRATSGVAA